MANASAKKRLKENTVYLCNLRVLVFGVWAVYLALQVGLWRASFDRAAAAVAVFAALVTLLVYQGLGSMMKPQFSETGDLLSGGGDMSVKGMVEYYYDVLYVTLFALLLSMWSTRWFAVWLLIPLYAVWYLTTSFLLPWLRGRSGGGADGDEAAAGESERARLKREKKEKKAQAIRYSKY